jgi:acyl carrier protein phosphodiesterase
VGLDLFWDREIGDEELRTLLADRRSPARLLAIRRLLERGEWTEICRYLTLADIADVLPSIRFREPHLQRFWEDAVTLWKREAR